VERTRSLGPVLTPDKTRSGDHRRPTAADGAAPRRGRAKSKAKWSYQRLVVYDMLIDLSKALTMPLKENLYRDTVKCLPAKAPHAISPDAPVWQALDSMRENHSGCMLVMDQDRLVGILTERDVLKRVLKPRLDRQLPVRSVMTSDPTTISSDEAITSALGKMLAGGYRHMPVVDKRGRPTGRVSVREIVHYMVEHFPKAVYNLPPRPDQVPAASEGA